MTDKEKLEKIKALADKMYSRMAYLTSDTRPIRQAMDEYHQFIINEYYKEEPVNEDLEEAAVEICSKVIKGETIIIDGYEYVVLSDAEECFKAGAEWQKVQDYFKIIYPKIITEGTIEQYAQKVAYDMSNDWAIDNPTWDDVQNACKLGANWQKEKDESTTEDLGEYINELSKQFSEVSFAKLSRIAVRVAKWQRKQDQETIELAEDHAMLAGMEKMKEQMMKNAIDGYVIEDIEEGNGDFLLSAEYISKSMGLKDRQKVKVIVIRED